MADRVMMLDGGKLEQIGTPREVARRLWKENEKQKRRYVPSVAGLFFSVEEHQPQNTEIPLSVREGRRWLDTYVLTPNWQKKKKNAENRGEGEKKEDSPNRAFLKSNEDRKRENPVLSAQNLFFRYDKHGREVLRDLSLDVMAGEWLTIGSNGSGKSTLLKMLAGLLKPQHGKTLLKGKRLTGPDPQNIGYLPQNPKLYFLQDTVRKEMEGLVARFRLSGGENKINKWLSAFQLNGLENRHPYDLSGGELQKAAFACMSLTEPEILLVDEPTKGLDPDAKVQLAEVLTALHESGRTIVMVTHDVEYAAKYAGCCAMMFQGKVGSLAAPKRFFFF
ncbi:ATP-binding cassette domain-containing protein [Terrilactibacillus sp. S3-3]|nr:ATP-binding cassette domain-containing protein [Terrilactibacillus sp. S3-3]